MEGTTWLIASLLYGSGLRLLECLRLRVKDLDLSRREIQVRSGKGDRDRVTMVPVRLLDSLRMQTARVATIHADDLRAGHGAALLPGALEVKKPRAAWDLAWQYLFPAAQRSRVAADAERRHHLHETVVQRAFRRAVVAAGVDKPATCHSSATALLRICSSRVTTFGRSRSCSVTAAYRRP